MMKNSEWREWFRVRTKADELQPTDYRKFILNRKEWLVCLAQGSGILIVLAWFFYRSVWAVLPMLPLLFFWKIRRAEQLADRRRKELALQFRDLILAVSAGLQAGYSMENAFLEAGKDTDRLYGTQSLIGKEMNWIRRGIRNNVPLEELLLDLGKRSGAEDVENFAEIFSIARKRGGNLKEIIQRSAQMIGDKITVRREIQTMLASRKYEQKIMNLIPVLIIVYLQITSKGFFDVLYGNLPGVLIMTAALLVYMAAWRISEKMVEIEV